MVVAQFTNTHWIHPQVVFQGIVKREYVSQIMITGVYIIAQLTFWVNPSHHPQDVFQGIVRKNMGLRLWSLIGVYIIAQLTSWVNPSHGPQVVFQGIIYGQKKHGSQIIWTLVWLYIVAWLTGWVNPKHHPQVVFHGIVRKLIEDTNDFTPFFPIYNILTLDFF